MGCCASSLAGVAVPSLAHAVSSHALLRRVPLSSPLPVRPRRVLDPHHAGQVLASAEHRRDVLPRWGINSPVRCHPVEPGAYTGTVGWTSRDTYLLIVVPAVIVARGDVLRSHHVAGDTLLRWVRAKSLYAQEPRSGRQVIVRPDTLAGLLQCSLSTVHRCQRAARDLGLEVVITPGRMLSEIETYRARKAGSPQRGLSTVSAFVVPAWLPRPVSHDTPTSGRYFSSSVTESRTFKKRSAGPNGAPLRSAPRRRRTSPAWQLAADLCRQVNFLHKCPPGRIVGQLQRFAVCPQRWSADRITRAMDRVNVRLGYTAPVKPKTAPWGLLAWYLGQVDEVADHPTYAGPFPNQSTPPARNRT